MENNPYKVNTSTDKVQPQKYPSFKPYQGEQAQPQPNSQMYPAQNNSYNPYPQLKNPNDLQGQVKFLSSIVEYSNSQISDIFEHVALEIKKDEQDENQLTQLINSIYNPLEKGGKEQDFRKSLQLFLRILRQFLKMNSARLIIRKVQESQLDRDKQTLSSFVLMNFSHNAYNKYCVRFTGYQDSWNTIKQDKSKQQYVIMVFRGEIARVLQVNKHDIIINGFKQYSAYPLETLEFSFTIKKDNQKAPIKQIPEAQVIGQELYEQLKDHVTSITVEKQKVLDKIYFSLDQFLSEFSRNWNNLVGKMDTRGIKNGIRQYYKFPVSWESIATYVDVYDEEGWLSMETGDTQAWPVGYLPGKVSETFHTLDNLKDMFTQQQITDGIVVYREPTDMEEECDIIVEPISKQNNGMNFQELYL